MFALKFGTGNDAFAEDPNREVARILERVAMDVRDRGKINGVVCDYDGNPVGRWAYLVGPCPPEDEEIY